MNRTTRIQNMITLRNFFQVITFGIFLFQMQNSFKKYYQGPVVQERYLTSKYVTKQPKFYVCQVDSFNYTVAAANGYSGYVNWAKGKLIDSKITWKGKDGNMSYDKPFASEDSSFNSVFGEAKNLFLPRQGICKKLTVSDSDLFIQTKKRSMILIVDPYIENNLRATEMKQGRLYCGPSHNDRFDSASYNLEYRLHDSKIYDGHTCTDYKRANLSYGDCIDGVMEKLFLESYGCLPPWFPRNKGMICEIEGKMIDHPKVKLEDFTNFMLGRDLTLFKSC